MHTKQGHHHVEFCLYSKPSLFVLRRIKIGPKPQSVKDPSIIKPNLQYVPICLIRVHGKQASALTAFLKTNIIHI